MHNHYGGRRRRGERSWPSLLPPAIASLLPHRPPLPTAIIGDPSPRTSRSFARGGGSSNWLSAERGLLLLSQHEWRQLPRRWRGGGGEESTFCSLLRPPSLGRSLGAGLSFLFLFGGRGRGRGRAKGVGCFPLGNDIHRNSKLFHAFRIANK